MLSGFVHLSIMQALLLAFVPLVTSQQPSKDWCNTGIKVPDFSDDGGNASVDFLVVQAPLFSTNPRIGTKLRWLNLYHTALVVKQDLPGVASKNWTIEFDSVTNVLGAVLPSINGSTLSWNNDARFCITQGILWGEAHWSKMFDSVLRLNASSARKIFTDFIPSVNDTAHLSKPLYQLWRVISHSSETLVKDITCGDGVNWILDYASRELHATPAFELKYTSIVIRAERISSVRVNGADWPAVVKYFEGMSNVTEGKQSALRRVLELLSLMPVHYIYDSNQQAYFKVEGNHFPWLEAEYHAVPLEGPPSNTKIQREEQTYII